MFLVKTSLPRLFKADAMTIAPFIFIVEKQASNEALIAHEMVHYKEQAKCLTLPWWVMYLVSKKFRMNAEIRAYKVQIALGGISLDSAAWYLSSIYMLGITREEAKALLS